MKKFSVGSRSRLTRLAVLCAVMALPLVGASAAQAAIAGAPPPATTNHPDLLSVTLKGGGTSNVEFCFDKFLNNPGPLGFATPGDFQLGGYDANVSTSNGGAQTYKATAAFLDTAATNCVEADFPGTSPNTDYTFGFVQGGTTFPNGLGGIVSDSNFADSVPVVGASTSSGTAGHTTGPDLESVDVSASGNAIDYTFDQDVDVVTPGEFAFDNVAGTSFIATGVPTPEIINGNEVRVFFPAADDVTTAVVALIGTGAATDAAGNPETSNAPAALAVPGTGGTTTHPRVIGATLESPNQIAYTYDHSIALNGTAAAAGADTAAITSNGTLVTGISATVINPTTLLVTFPAVAASFDEEFVYAFAGGVPYGAGAPVTSLNGSLALGGGAPVGGNSGASADGFTNGPDARSVTFNDTTGQVTVDFDQRINPGTINAGDFILRSSTGVSLGSPTAAPAVLENTATPGDAQVTLQYSPSTLSLGEFLEIQGPPNSTAAATNPLDPITTAPSAVQTFPGAEAAGVGAPNIQQDLSDAVPAADFHKIGAKKIKTVKAKVLKHKRAKHAKKTHKKA